MHIKFNYKPVDRTLFTESRYKNPSKKFTNVASVPGKLIFLGPTQKLGSFCV